jgi:hypothetical protein
VIALKRREIEFLGSLISEKVFKVLALKFSRI